MQLEDYLSRAKLKLLCNSSSSATPGISPLAFVSLGSDTPVVDPVRPSVVDESPVPSDAASVGPSVAAETSESPVDDTRLLAPQSDVALVTEAPLDAPSSTELPHVTVPGLPPNTHPIVHSVVAAQQALSPAARTMFLKRENASEKRLGDVPTLYLSGRLFIPEHAKAAQLEFLHSVHSIAHASSGDMFERLHDRVRVTWDAMAADTARYYRSCGFCQHVAAGSRPTAVGRMQAFLYPHPHHTIFIDFYGILNPCEDLSPLDTTGTVHVYQYIISIVDGYSRFAVYLPSTHKSAAAAVAAYMHWCTFYGIPLNVRSDADKAFSSDLFKAALSAKGSKHDPVPPYTHHAMGLLERAHKPLGDLLKKLCGHAVSEWVKWIPLVMSWRNSTVNRDLGVCPHEALFCRPPTFAYERLGQNDVSHITPNDFANICAAMDVCVRTAAAVSSAQVAAQYNRKRSAPPVFKPGDHVLVYFPDRISKAHTFYRGPFVVLSPSDSSGNYYRCRDLVQLIEYDVHVERMKPFDMSRTSLIEQQQRQLPSSDLLIVTGVEDHRMNDAQGLYEFYIRFYSGYHAWKLYPEVQNIDLVKDYVSRHRLNARKQTPALQFTRITGQHAPPSAPRARPASSRAGGEGRRKRRAVWGRHPASDPDSLPFGILFPNSEPLGYPAT